ncbi:uncharacterized protein LOC130814083 isoform X2 [Amaranthus tricolor]|uniref:uncharacterized protein LOC130814083 isoform X2 n=1 Tax=Amaranthus tricolor TaxID=29722 RepID=UPI002583A919|nr:uncharacterized protein LOC130814083 isoform X2 [Amaranthus tricolor]
MSGGFFRGTSADQDTRFSNKQAKLLKTQKFAPELEHLVDITKVKMDVIKPWIAKRVTEFLEGFEDEVLINFIYTLLEGKEVNGKKIQIQLTGFMEKNTGKFMKELWALLLSAQKNASGVPQQFLDAKEEETRKKMVETDRIFNEIQRREEKEVRESQQEKERQMDDGTGNNRAEDSNGRRERGSGVQSGDEKGADAQNGFRGRSSEKSLSRSISVSPGAKKRSVSPQGKRRPPRRSITPIRQSSRESMSPRRRSFSRRSPSPLRRRARSPVRRRSPSPFRRRSPSPARRSPSPSRRRSRSPVRRWSRSPAKRLSRSPVRHRSPPRRRRSPSPWRRRSPSPGRHRSPPPSRRSRRSTSSPRSRSPVKSRSPSPFRRRFYSPARRSSYAARRRSPSPAPRHRSPYPARRRSPSPTRRRSPSPTRRRSPSPAQRRSPSPAKRRSPSPGRRKTSYPARHRSPSPRSRRSLSPVDRRSLSPIQERSPVPGRRRTSTLTPSRSPSPASQLSGSPVRHSSASPVKMTSPRLQKSLNGSPRERNRNLEPATIMSRRQPISLSPQRDHSIRRESNRKVPPVAASPEKSPHVEVRNQNFDKDRRLASLENRVGEKLVPNGSQSPIKSRDQRVRRVSPETTVERQQSDRKYEDKKLEERKSGRSSVVKQRESPDRPTSEEASLKEVHHLKKSPHRVSLTGDRPDTYTGDFSKFDEKRNSQAKDVGNNMSESLVKSHKKRRSSAYSDSESEGSDKHTGKRKRRRSKRKEVTSDDTSSESEIEDRKEAKRKKKEERKARKEERRRRREERRRKREEKRASKRKPKSNDADALSSGPENIEKDVNTSNDGRRKKYSSEEETESQKKRLEIELREKALESLRAKKGISH